MFLNNKNNSKTIKNIFFATSATLLLLTVNNVVQADQVTADDSEIKQSVISNVNDTLTSETTSSEDKNENSSSNVSEIRRTTVINSEVNATSEGSIPSETTSSQSKATSSINLTLSQRNVNSATASTLFAEAVVQQPDKINLGDSAYPRTDAVDVASYQHYLTQNDFNTMKAQGVKTVVVKLTEGTSYINPSAASQIQMAKNAGLNVAAYHFALFTNESTAIAEANYFLNVLKRYGLGAETAVVADMESSAVLNSSGAGNLNSFWNVLRANGYMNDVVYTSLSFDRSYNFSSTVGKKKTWIAQYPYSPRANNLLHQEYGAWQYSSTGYINGKGAIDFTIDYAGIFSMYEEKYENGYWYVYLNGVMQTGFVKLPDGRITYYDNNGHIVNGLYKANDGYTYYFSEQNGNMHRGELYLNGNWYYFDIDNGRMATGFVKLPDGRTVYYDNEGHIVNGSKTINGETYYFSLTDGHMMANSFVYDAENHFIRYYGKNGKMVTGTMNINGLTYTFDNEGKLKSTSTLTVTIDGKWYQVDSLGYAKLLK